MGKRKLWDTFDGEPFLDNPHLAILTNPSKRGKKKMAKRRMPRRDSKGRFIKLPWTYPDYAEQNMLIYLERVRNKYVIDLKQTCA